ncbi:MAG: DNA adenine methylase [Spirochaetota bacterium]|nr:DNA adenine methylase [Spirochaetota bacterium]
MIVNYTERDRIYTESHLIAYIGNKRRLLSLIQKALERLDIDPRARETVFYDPFAGSGVVSRLAKTQGFKVIANDWEHYSYVINKAYLELNESDIPGLFEEHGDLHQVIDHLNSLPAPTPDKSYISRYYCPKNTENPDLINERLFYTRESGEKIDSIRYAIDQTKLHSNKEKDNAARGLLLALLLYEGATRANTSGVFKAFHNGFGGLGKDALGRIMRPLKLPYPVLFEGKHDSKVFKQCANRLTKKLKSRIRVDVAYLDPPYNQHQYGSNYHLLNTIALHDKPQVNEAIYINGKKVDKSAIRKDWVNTRSTYCYRDSALRDFEELIDNMNARYILVSYSIDGIIPFDDMLNCLSRRGMLSIVTSEYTKYRGGKQSLTTEKSNIEFLLLVDTDKPANQADILKVKETLVHRKILLCLKKTVDSSIITERGFSLSRRSSGICIYEKPYGGVLLTLVIKHDHYILEESLKPNSESDIKSWQELSYKLKEQLADDLKEITSISKDREIEILINLIHSLIFQGKTANSILLEREIMSHFRKIPPLLKKFNNKKAYYKSLTTIQQIINLTVLIKKELPKTYNHKIFNLHLEKLKQIIETKINHFSERHDTLVNSLKSSLKEQYVQHLVVA